MENIRNIKNEEAFLNYNTKTRRRARRHSRAIAKTKKNIKNRIFILNVFMSIIFFILLQTGYTDLVNISSDSLITKNKNDELKLELNNLEEVLRPLKSNKRIEKIAKARLNMVKPTLENIVEINNENSKSINIADLTPENFKNKENILSALANIFR